MVTIVRRHSLTVVVCGVWVCDPRIGFWRVGLKRIGSKRIVLLQFSVSTALYLLVLAAQAICQKTAAAKGADSVVAERVGDTAFVRPGSPSFQSLTPRQQAL